MAETMKVEGEGSKEAVALRLLQMLMSIESFSSRKELLDAYVDCRSAAYGNRFQSK